MEILFTQWTNTHLLFDASLRRQASAGRLVSSDGPQEVVRMEEKSFPARKSRRRPSNTVCVGESGTWAAANCCASACNQGLIDL